MPCHRAKSARQDAPPTEKENDIIKALYALLFKRKRFIKIPLSALFVGELALRSTLLSTLTLFSEVQLPYLVPEFS